MLDLKLKEFKVCSLKCYIKLLNKQMEYAHAMQQFGGVVDSTATGPLAPNLTSFLPTASLTASPIAILLPTTFLHATPSTTYFNIHHAGFPTAGPFLASCFQSNPQV